MVLTTARKPAMLAAVNNTAFRFKSEKTPDSLEKPLEKQPADALADPKEACK
jgi:hypothetical protein